MGTVGRRNGIITYVNVECEWCQTVVHRRAGSVGKGRFCSRSCSAKYGLSIREKRGRVTVVCSGCHEPFQKWRNDVPRSELHFHNLACKSAYFQARTRNMAILRDRVFERDGGRCVDCGGWRFLETHHVNGDGRDNRMDNLVLVCKKCHVSRHQALSGKNLNGTPLRL